MIENWFLLGLFTGLGLFFLGIEAALSHTNRLYFELLETKGKLSGKILSQFSRKPAVVSGILWGAAVFCLLLSAYMIFVLMDVALLGDYLLFGLLVFLLLLCLVLISRGLFLSFPQWVLRTLAIPLWILYQIFYPVVYVLVFVPYLLLKKIVLPPSVSEKNPFRFAGLGFYFQYENQENEWEEVQTDSDIDNKIFANALAFKNIRVKECMIPRTEITAVNFSENVQNFIRTAIESGHSKILVYRETLDEVIGYCHMVELFRRPKTLSEIITPIITVPETALVNDVLERFNVERKSIALVIDEFGGTAGLITREDILESIFGEIQDEYDQSEDWTEKQLDDRNYLFSGRQEIYYLNEKYGFNLPEGDYETLGGLLMASHGTFPQTGTKITLADCDFEVIATRNARLETIKLTRHIPE
ncbi:MAG: HlyC/CorC family transporter [Verrucomicrobia bacterium]|nr:HlyC/CorC family transporter [Cytophagales bacterium]